jgi:hypothetical protein
MIIEQLFILRQPMGKKRLLNGYFKMELQVQRIGKFFLILRFGSKPIHDAMRGKFTDITEVF